MADDRVTIDGTTILDNVEDRQVEFEGEASGDRYPFALRYDVLEALSGSPPADDVIPLFDRYRDRIARMAADALARDTDAAMIVISENDLV